jgi:hypothetical protein
MEREVEILSGGKPVPLNEFTRKIVLNTLLGMLGSLRDVGLDGEIHITVKPGK